MATKNTALILALLAVLATNTLMAEDLNQEALLQRAKILAANPNEAKTLEDATLLNNMGLKLSNVGHYDQATTLYQRSLTITEKALGKNDFKVSIVLANLASLYQTKGKYQQAESLYQRSLTIREEKLGKEHPLVATTLNDLATLYEAQGQYEQAEILQQRSLIILEKTVGKEHLAVAHNLNNFASFYKDQGKYEQAESLYTRSLNIREKALGKDHPDVANSLNNLAALYQKQGKYDLAEPLYQRVITILKKSTGEDSFHIATCLNNLAMLYEAQGRYVEAEFFLKESLNITEITLGKDHPDVVLKLNNLAELYRTQGKLTEAAPLYKRSIDISNSLGDEHPLVATILGNLALAYQELGDYAQADSLYARSIEIRLKTLGKEHPDFANSLINVGELYFKQGKYKSSEEVYLLSLKILEKVFGKNSPNITQNLNALAWLYLAQDKREIVKPLLQRSLRISNQALEHWLWGAGDKTRQAYLQEETGRRNAYLSFYSLANTPEEALYFSLSRKNLLLRIASEASSLAKQSHDPSVKKQKQQLDALRTQLATFAFSGKADKTKIQALEEQANQLEMQLSQKVAGFKRSKTDVTAKEVIKILKEKQVLIDFLVYEDFDFKTKKLKTKQLIALLADKNGVRLIKLGDFAPIIEAIKTYQANIVISNARDTPRDEQKLQQSANILYQLLWQPLVEHLKDKTTVYIVPDGELNLLPFNALQDEQGQYLSHKQQLIQLSSARDLVLPPLTAKAQTTAIFADPDYGASNNTAANTSATSLKEIVFTPLPNTSTEAKQIQQLMTQQKITAKLFTQKNATEQAVKNLKSPKILHLATHGFFLEQQKIDNKTLEQNLNRSVLEVSQAYIENPLTRSGLAFVNANLATQERDKNDGILTALEVLNLKLEGTDLVTLSACETAKGDIKIGEGVYSLNRAFQEAGAKAVLSTLWEIDDVATVEFMRKFYNRFLKTQSAQQALHETQQEFRQHDKFKDPFYWAGFVVTGVN